jgi:hypothetical protein
VSSNQEQYAHLNQRRQQTIEALYREMIGEQLTPTRVLSTSLIDEVLASNAQSDQLLKALLTSAASDEQRFSMLQGQDKTVLTKLILENIDLLVALSDNGDIQEQYAKYEQQLTMINHTYDSIIGHHYQALMNAYSKSVAVDGFYLRDVDLQVLADMQKKPLKLYRRSDLNVRQYAVQTYGEWDGEPIEVYHRGAHYERAHSGA